MFFKSNRSINSTQSSKSKLYNYDYKALKSKLDNIDNLNNFSTKGDNIISFPNAKGKFEKFKIIELSVMQKRLQEKYPSIRSYVGYGIDNPSNYLRFSISPYKGFSGILLGNDKPLYYQPHTDLKNGFYILEHSPEEIIITSTCKTLTQNKNFAYSHTSHTNKIKTSEKRVFNIALSATGEYSIFHGGTLANVNAAIVSSLTNINAVFERDLNISFVLVENNDAIVYLNAESDPYSNFPSNYGEELQQNLDTTIGNTNYNIGHLLSAVGIGGNANCIGCICEDGKKGSAYSSSDFPSGFHFDFSLLAHEIGHQLGANHTWTYLGNEGTKVQVEPGSGSTIMGYSGIGRSANIQLANDSYFHGISIEQINNVVSKTQCASGTLLNNLSPIANAGTNLTHPIGTPFKLIGVTDKDDNGTLTYCWEQINDNGSKTVYPNPDLSDSDAVLFRSFPPTNNPIRYFPNLLDLRFGLNETLWEKVPNVNRTADFRLTVRDNNPEGGKTSFDDITLTFDNAYGPFEIINFAEEDLILTAGSTQTIRWLVNNTDNIDGGENVNILLSTNGGISYDTVIAKNIPNNGSYTFDIPDIIASECRFMLEASNHHFFAVNKSDIAIGVEVVNTCKKFESHESLNLQIISDETNTISTLIHSITIPESSIISDINIGVAISHPIIGDLGITITSPKGTEVILKTYKSCSTEENLFTVFDDQTLNFNCAKSDLNINQKSLSGTLTTFSNEDAIGDWTIEIMDNGTENIGIFNSWFIELCKKEQKDIALNDEIFNEFTIFPNPNSGSFSIKAKALHSYKNLNIEIFNLSGQLVYTEFIPETTFLNKNVTTLGLQSGMYFLRITDKNASFSEKIIIN
ncbi:zinc-dependent metalloprotease [Hyunsoonleella pacifica]|uniref:zinc-dependent metalloprotease n=1 Tax=Hyunsoonleella pacifica TaxID=1080224 RepID=UPI0013EEEC17|nr:zinc-dependent metalloprotease family protein [Hyunsoonleella pacifica]GGD07388.1 hypothetical protein GCM10011368_06640 [Hyunsoonleella pacifica]